eukprot:1532614-Prymnesium_polylepis.1
MRTAIPSTTRKSSVLSHLWLQPCHLLDWKGSLAGPCAACGCDRNCLCPPLKPLEKPPALCRLCVGLREWWWMV